MGISRRPISARGIALVMVMVLVAAASIMTYAVLASTSVRAQVSASAQDRLQRQYLADSGLNLALYYLQNPSASPVALTYGEYGNVHYPGENAISFDGVPGTISVSVTNPANGVFSVTSVGTVNGESSTSRATIDITKFKTFTYAANLRGANTLNSKVSISGGVITDGNLTRNSASLSGAIVAANGANLGGTNIGSTQLTYPASITHYVPYYFYNGKRYRAARLGTNVGGLIYDLDVVNNPCNVWYADRNVKFLLGTVVPGTIIADDSSKLTIQASVTITPVSGMPALIAGDDVEFNGNGRTLQCNGLTYVGGRISGAGSNSTCQFNVSGAFVAAYDGWPFKSDYEGFVNLQYNASRAGAKALFDEIEPITALNVQSWGKSN